MLGALVLFCMASMIGGVVIPPIMSIAAFPATFLVTRRIVNSQGVTVEDIMLGRVPIRVPLWGALLVSGFQSYVCLAWAASIVGTIGYSFAEFSGVSGVFYYILVFLACTTPAHVCLRMTAAAPVKTVQHMAIPITGLITACVTIAFLFSPDLTQVAWSWVPTIESMPAPDAGE